MSTNPWLEFVDRYQSKPVAFVRECLGVEPEPYQVECLEAYGRGDRRIAMRSGHGVGKTAVLAWIIVHQLVFFLPQKTVVTAPTQAQLIDALMAEVKTWLKRLPKAVVDLYEIKAERIELRGAPEESFVSFRTSSAEKPEALAGIHADAGRVLLVVDEASGVVDAVFQAGAGSMSGHNCTTILAGNPVRSSGLFFDVFHRIAHMWTTIHISCIDSKRVARDFIEQIRVTYGERSNAYRVRVEGNFPLADSDTVIPFELAEGARQRDVKAKNVRPIWGVDVARFGDDSSALAKRQGNVLLEKVKKRHALETMQVAGWIKQEWDDTPLSMRPEAINVDAIGIGAGVADRLRELGLPAFAINVSELPGMTDRFPRLRDELWWKTRQWLEPRDCNLADDDELIRDLVAPKYEIMDSNGRIKIESKKQMKKRLGRSPDLADAFNLTMASEASKMAYGDAQQGSFSWKQPLGRIIKGIV